MWLCTYYLISIISSSVIFCRPLAVFHPSPSTLSPSFALPLPSLSPPPPLSLSLSPPTLSLSPHPSPPLSLHCLFSISSATNNFTPNHHRLGDYRLHGFLPSDGIHSYQLSGPSLLYSRQFSPDPYLSFTTFQRTYYPLRLSRSVRGTVSLFTSTYIHMHASFCVYHDGWSCVTG